MVKSLIEVCRKHEKLGYFSIVITIVFAIWFANYFGLLGPKLSGMSEQGSFGDTFGSVNALFAGLAFAGIAYSIIIQSDQLKVSRAEMKAAQDTLAKTADNLRQQNAAALKQGFENTFFKMFVSFNVVIQGFSAIGTGNPSSKQRDVRGRDVFEAHFKLIDRQFKTKMLAHREKVSRELELEGKLSEALDYNDEDVPKEIRSQILKEVLIVLQKTYGDDLGQYFRLLYTLLSFIKHSALFPEEKIFYAKFIRAQLSSHESTIIAILYAEHHCSENLRVLIEEYGILKNFDLENVFIFDIVDNMKNEAFGNSSVFN